MWGLIFTVTAPIAWIVGNLFRKFASPTFFFAGSMGEIAVKRLGFMFGPQALCLAVLALVTSLPFDKSDIKSSLSNNNRPAKIATDMPSTPNVPSSANAVSNQWSNSTPSTEYKSQTPAGANSPPSIGAGIGQPNPSAEDEFKRHFLSLCPGGVALNCLPKSSGPVVFGDPAAAERAAEQDIARGISTSQGASDAMEDGATGFGARLCGIVMSNDSSALGKHVAAVRLFNPRPSDGRASDICTKYATQYL